MTAALLREAADRLDARIEVATQIDRTDWVEEWKALAAWLREHAHWSIPDANALSVARAILGADS